MASEWDVLKAHARAQCVTVKDRLWCEMALALGEAARAMERRMDAQIERSILGPREGYYTRAAKDEAIRKAATAAEMQRRDTERAERCAAKAAKRAAREERKRMRREACDSSEAVAFQRHRLWYARSRLRHARASGERPWAWASDFVSHEEYVASFRADVREEELRYAIACAEAGAVPGGRVH